jgi:hypothetical protein
MLDHGLTSTSDEDQPMAFVDDAPISISDIPASKTQETESDDSGSCSSSLDQLSFVIPSSNTDQTESNPGSVTLMVETGDEGFALSPAHNEAENIVVV